eukprot:Lankesteria_metandrocarpae@DN9127_c0_g1_i1.p1
MLGGAVNLAARIGSTMAEILNVAEEVNFLAGCSKIDVIPSSTVASPSLELLRDQKRRLQPAAEYHIASQCHHENELPFGLEFEFNEGKRDQLPRGLRVQTPEKDLTHQSQNHTTPICNRSHLQIDIEAVGGVGKVILVNVQTREERYTKERFSASQVRIPFTSENEVVTVWITTLEDSKELQREVDAKKPLMEWLGDKIELLTGGPNVTAAADRAKRDELYSKFTRSQYRVDIPVAAFEAEIPSQNSEVPSSSTIWALLSRDGKVYSENNRSREFPPLVLFQMLQLSKSGENPTATFQSVTSRPRIAFYVKKYLQGMHSLSRCDGSTDAVYIGLHSDPVDTLISDILAKSSSAASHHNSSTSRALNNTTRRTSRDPRFTATAPRTIKTVEKLEDRKYKIDNRYCAIDILEVIPNSHQSAVRSLVLQEGWTFDEAADKLGVLREPTHFVREGGGLQALQDYLLSSDDGLEWLTISADAPPLSYLASDYALLPDRKTYCPLQSPEGMQPALLSGVQLMKLVIEQQYDCAAADCTPVMAAAHMTARRLDSSRYAATDLVPQEILPDFEGSDVPWEASVDTTKMMSLALHRNALRERVALEYLQLQGNFSVEAKLGSHLLPVRMKVTPSDDSSITYAHSEGRVCLVVVGADGGFTPLSQHLDKLQELGATTNATTTTGSTTTESSHVSRSGFPFTERGDKSKVGMYIKESVSSPRSLKPTRF